MKYSNNINVVTSTHQSKKYGFEVNAKSFSILTSGIYQDKIKAVIREYSTNAVDSHIEAKNDLPFEVHLPTEKECYFYVRDYGVGLDDNEIESVYCSLFSSTKDNSNKFNGIFGIGCAAAHSYHTKSFIVESWKDGYHYIYSCFIGIDGIPSYSQLLKEFSQDPEGVKVQITVDQDDIDEFEETAKSVYQWFSLKPNFVGKQIQIGNPVIQKYKNYATIGGSCLAIMGNIAYPIAEHYSLSKYTNLIKSGICIYFDIGEISFNPSRESLEYSDRTIANIVKKFKLILDEIKNSIENDIQNCKSEWEALCTFNHLTTTYISIKGIKDLIGNTFEYNNKTLTAFKELRIPNSFFLSNKNPKYKTSLYLSKNSNYVINDLKIGSISRCKLLAKTSLETYLISKEDLEECEITYSEECFILASSLPKPAQVYGQQIRNKLTSFMEVLDIKLKTQAYVSAEVDTVKDPNKVYVVRKGYNLIYDKEISPHSLYDMLKKVDITQKVYCIGRKEEQKLVNLGFTHIRELVEASLQIDTEKFNKNIDFFAKYRDWNQMRYRYSTIFDNICKYKKHISATSELQQLIEIIDFLHSNKTKYTDLNNLGSKLINCGKFIDPANIDIKNYEKLINKYELFGYNVTDSCYKFYLKGIDNVSS